MTGEEKIVRHGKISAVYPERHTVRVTFEDADEVVSAEMPYLTTSASKNNLYRLPDIEEEVVCIFEGNDAGEGDGFCIGSFYNEKNVPRETNQDVFRLDCIGEFSYLAGNVVELDKSFGFYAGNYIIERANWKIGSGFACNLDLRKCLKGY